MFEDFSRAYYRASMNIVEYDDGPVIEQTVYDFIDTELFEGADSPVLMRIGLDSGNRFTVSSESAIPRDVLAVPGEMRLTEGPRNVYLLKPEHANAMEVFYG